MDDDFEDGDRDLRHGQAGPRGGQSEMTSMKVNPASVPGGQARV
jgi:hypothetical protein